MSDTKTDSVSEPSGASENSTFVSTPIPAIVAIALLLGVIVLDMWVPFGRPWSNLYFLVAVYSGLFLRGRIEIALYGAIIASTLLVPSVFRPGGIALGTALLNRVAGIVAGLMMVGLIWGRRRYVAALRLANEELEGKIAARTSELRLANETLQREVAERHRTQEALCASHARLEAVSRELITTQESERRHIARELHDEIGQILTAIKMNIRRAQAVADASVRLLLEENSKMIDHTIAQVRNLSLSLRPLQLDELGLVAALHWLIRHQGQSGGFEGRLDVDLKEVRLSPDLETVCFRIVQEALTNAVRHAQPKNLVVKLWVAGDQVKLSVHDDGVGFNVGQTRQHAQDGGSVGLSSMRERASLIGGHLDIESTPASGTTIHASLPLAMAK
jgi:signal transduction histidine kinase